MTKIHDFLARIDRLDDEATPGDWVPADLFTGAISTLDEISLAENPSGLVAAVPEHRTRPHRPAQDAQLIAGYRTAAPAMAKALRRVMDWPTMPEGTEAFRGYNLALKRIKGAIIDVLEVHGD